MAIPCRRGVLTPRTSRLFFLLCVLWLAAAGALSGEGAQPRPGLSPRKLLDELPFGIHGFLEARAGTRTRDDGRQSKTGSIGEMRLQLDLDKALDWAEMRLKTDFVRDWTTSEWDTDVREANVVLTAFEFADIKLGRQILTWGTGDLLFINDLFPKDWQSFFIGRDDEYLKAPSDAAKVSFFTDFANINLVYTPQFDPDRFITGERLSYWNPTLGRLAGEDDRVHAERPHDWFGDDEIAARISRNLGGYELALYGYHGYWKTPEGFNPLTGRATYPELSVYGASVRGAIGKGIGNIEIGYYDSRDDSSGDDPLVRNSEFRFLVGYEQEVARNFTAGVQYYLELMMDHGAYERTLPPGMHARDEDRHVVTLRLTKLLMNQNLKLSLFAYCSPSDGDAHLRPKVHYKINDQWSAEAGANIFVGNHDHTFFGQFENNTNVYTGLRWSF